MSDIFLSFLLSTFLPEAAKKQQKNAVSDTDAVADKAELLRLITKVQAKSEGCPTEADITKEVEAVRAARYKKAQKK